MRWYAEREPATAARVHRWLSATGLVLAAWTADGAGSVDRSTASGTGLYDLASGTWDARALDLARIEVGRLPSLVEPTDVIGHVTDAAAARLGLPAGTPVVAGGGDGPLANLGAGAVEQGVAAVTIGTSGALRVTVPAPAGDPEGRLFCYALGLGRWVVGGAVSNGGSVLAWARSRLFPDLDDGAALDRLAGTVAPGADGLVALPALDGERAPLWDPERRGALLGLTVAHGREHVVRALLEGVALQLAAVSAALRDAGHAPVRYRATGGFLQGPTWPGIVAAALGAPLEVPEGEPSTLGAALLALEGLGLGDALACARAVPVARVITPEPAALRWGAAALPRFLDLQARLA